MVGCQEIKPEYSFLDDLKADSLDTVRCDWCFGLEDLWECLLREGARLGIVKEREDGWFVMCLW